MNILNIKYADDRWSPTFLHNILLKKQANGIKYKRVKSQKKK